MHVNDGHPVWKKKKKSTIFVTWLLIVRYCLQNDEPIIEDEEDDDDDDEDDDDVEGMFPHLEIKEILYFLTFQFATSLKARQLLKIKDISAFWFLIF